MNEFPPRYFAQSESAKLYEHKQEKTTEEHKLSKEILITKLKNSQKNHKNIPIQ